jgi:hypothetical protein
MATTKKKITAKKPAPKTAGSREATPKSPAATPREEALANDALKLVDKAAALLRKGIRSGAETTQRKSRGKASGSRLLTRPRPSW